MKPIWKKLTYVVLVLGVAGLMVFVLAPSAIQVEVARVERGPLRVTIDEDGEARAHDRFVIAAPVTGQLSRVELHDGDRVARGQIVAILTPLPLGQREHAELVARVRAAEALKREADETVERAGADYDQARRELARATRLAQGGLVSQQSLEQANNDEISKATQLEAAKFKAQAAASDVSFARAGLIAVSGSGDANRIVKLRSPVPGSVLRVIEKSERVMDAGAPILVLGDPAKLEVVVDLLSTDAVKVKTGAPALIEGWGGDQPILARVRTVEPSAFTKVSALGIEEQRVNVIADLLEFNPRLGDGYRVEARIIVWETQSALKAPSSALFRRGNRWAVFVVEAGRARRKEVEMGHRTPSETEVLAGLDEGDDVILHPTNDIDEGTRVKHQ
jgi:HlyD family secretion protein